MIKKFAKMKLKNQKKLALLMILPIFFASFSLLFLTLFDANEEAFKNHGFFMKQEPIYQIKHLYLKKHL